PIRSPKIVKLICRFNYPSPVRLEELHANRIAFAMDWLAVGHPSCGAKLSRARGKHQPRILVPAPDADHSCTLCADIFRKRSFRAGKLAITFQNHGNFHLDPEFPAWMGMDVSMCHRSSILRGTQRCVQWNSWRCRGVSCDKARGPRRPIAFPECPHPRDTRQCRR